jgi:TonB family protein
MMKFRSTLSVAVFSALPALLFAGKTNPAPLDTFSPEYPAELISTGKDGIAKITFVINEKGLVEEPEIADCSEPEFGEAALVAIKEWRFKPATVDGKPVPKKVSLPFKFRASPENKLNAHLGRTVFKPIDAKIVKIRKLDERPVVLKEAPAPYPPELAGSGLDERVKVNVIIGPDGKVYNPEVSKIKNENFHTPALLAAAGYEFKPPVMDGKPVTCVFKVTIWVHEVGSPEGVTNGT